MEEEYNITDIVNNEMQPVEPIIQLQQNLQQKAKAKESGATSLYDSLKVPYFGGVGVQTQPAKPSIEYQIPIEEGYNLVGDEYIAKYPNYEVGRDNAEYAAQTQSTFDKWSNGLTKAGANLLTTVAGNTVGFVVGAAEGVSQGSWNAVFDNGFSNALADWNDKLNYQLPNYVSKDEQDDNFFESLGNANFWAKDVAGGFSFTLGTIVSEAIWAYATGGIANSAKWGLQGAKLANKARWGKVALGAEEAAVGLANSKKFLASGTDKLYRVGALETNTAKLFANTSKTLNTARFLATSSGNEAGIEALHYKREQTENFYRDFETLNGRDPSEQEISEFNDNLEASANAIFATNMAILAPSNIAMFGSIFNIASPTKGISKAMNKSLFGIGVEKTAGEAGEVAYKGLQATGKQKVAQYTYAALKPLVTEGLWEEGLQGVTTKTAENWISSTYDPKYNNQTLALSDATYKAFAEQYGSKEGWKEIGIGAIIGGGSSLVIGKGKFQEVREFDKEQAYQDNYVSKGLNQFGDNSALATDSIVKKFMMNARVANAVERQKDAIDKGDDVGAVLAQQDQLVAELQFKKAMGENTKELISKYDTALQALTPSDFEERGIEDPDSYKENVLNGYKDLVNSYESASDFADAVLGDSKILGQDIETQTLKDSLTYSIVSGQKSNKVMDEVMGVMTQIMGADTVKSLQIQTELQKMGREKIKEVRAINTQIAQSDTEVKNLSRELQRLQVSKDEEKGTRLQAVQEKLTDALEKQTELRAEREVLAQEVSQESVRRSNIQGTDLTSFDLTGQFISGNDLADIDQKLQNIEDSIKSYKGVNHEIYYDLLDLKRQYNQAKESFFSFQSSVDSIINGDFAPKFSKANGLLGRVINGKNEPVNNFTNKFLQEIYDNYVNSVARTAEQTLTEDIISDEDYNLFLSTGEVSQDILNKLAEKVKVKGDLTSREKEIYDARTQEINALTQPNPNKPDLSEASLINKELEGLEKEKKALEENLKVSENAMTLKELETTLKNTPKYITVVENVESTKKGLEDYVSRLKTRIEKLQEQYDEEGLTQPTDPTVDAFAEENNEGILEYEEVNFGDNTAVVYQTTNDDSWSGKGSSFRSTWNVLKFNQGTYAHVRILATTSQKEKYSEDKNSEFSKNLRELAKNNRNSNNVVLIDIRPKEERSKKEDKSKIKESIEFFTKDLLETEEKIDKLTAKGSTETKKVNPEYESLENEISNLKSSKVFKEYQKVQKQLNEVNDKIKDIKGVVSEEKRLRQEIEQAFNKDYPLLTQDVDEMIKGKPSKSEIEKYQELYNKQDKFTASEQNEFEELQPRMQRWFMAQSLPVRGRTIADLIELLSQLETTLDRDETLNEINSDELVQETAQAKDSHSTERQDILQNISGNAVVKIVDADMYFIHIDAKSIIGKLLPTVSTASVQTVNSKGKLNKEQDLTPKILNENNKKPGTLFKIGNTKITIGQRGSVVIPLQDYNEVKDILNMYYFDSNSGKWSYADVYEFLEDGTTRKIESEFDTNTISDYLYDAQIGDSLNLFVDMQTDWNQDLIYQSLQEIENNGEISETLKTDIQNTLEITSRKGRDNNSTLKASYNNQGAAFDNFLYVRKKYADRFIELLESEQSLLNLPSIIDLEAELSVKDMFLGTPNFQLDNDLRPKELPITERGAETVITQGYILGNQMILANKNLNTEDISRLYVTNLARVNPELKIPVVVLKKGKYQFAFPITMVKTQEDKSDQLEAILVAVETDIEAVKLINNLMISLGLNTRITNLTPEIIDSLREDLTNYTTFRTADEIAETSYNKNQLITDATIKVDLENEVISSPKITVDYSTLTIGNLEDTETDAVNLRQSIVEDLRDIERIVNSSIEIPDQNKLIQAFDNNVVENQGTDIMNRKDVNFIKEVFFTTEGRLKSIQGRAVEVIGKDKLLRLRDKLQQLQFYEAQIKTIKDKNTENNLKCSN